MIKGRNILVTGASGGLGKAVCIELQRLEAVVHPTLRSTPLSVLGQEVFKNAILADFSNHSDVDELFQTLKDRKVQLDGIVHCAGSEVISPLRLSGRFQYETAMMAAESAFQLLAHASRKDTMSLRSSIVLMSSVAAQRGTNGMVAYAASKGAIESMARAAAIELSSRDIRVNVVATGAFRSPMHSRITKTMSLGMVDNYIQKHPLGVGDTEYVVPTIVHMLDYETSGWVTGTVSVVDGGFMAKG